VGDLYILGVLLRFSKQGIAMEWRWGGCGILFLRDQLLMETRVP